MTPLARAVEAALFAAEEPLTMAALAQVVGADPAEAVAAVAARHAGGGIELVERGQRWHFQTAPDLAHILRREREEPRKLGRAAIETLAIVAYHEPVSRAEVEAIRGVQVAKGTIDTLMAAGWIAPAGRREGPGRPIIYRTTPAFLAQFGLGSRRDLPGIEDLRAAGLLDPVDPTMLELGLANGQEDD